MDLNQELIFPYPYLIDAMDKHYRIEFPPSNTEGKNIKEFYKKYQHSHGMSLFRKKRLSILITTFWDYPHTGGLSNYITELSDGLRKQGHYVDVISPKQFPAKKVAAFRKTIVPELKEFFTKRYGVVNSKILQNSRLLYIYEEMLKTVDLEKYDIFHAQDLFTANILGRFNQKYGKPLFFTPHGMFTFNRLKFNIFDKGSVEEAYYTQMEKQAIKFASHLIILNNSFRRPLMTLGTKQEHMTTVITGINYQEEYTKTPSDQSKLTITCIARLGPRKGQKYLLDALAQIREYTNNVEVLIVGDGEMRDSLENQAASLNLSMVKFLGTRDDVPYILSKTDIFVLPTINDSLPISIIEAMHSGAAIITTDCGGIPEIVRHNQTGIIIKPQDTETLARALKFFIVNKGARDWMAANAKTFANKHLTRDRMVLNIEDLYTKALNSFKSGVVL
ncbi:glycosyltransferase family 4 protein [Priestia megaterium]|nr:glycosyltransferase family 4 protein [Priestia megaterium]